MRFHILTWGCQMNDHDSEKLSGLLVQQGHDPVASLDEADLVLLNTCSIREKAVQKAYSDLGRLRLEKQKRPLIVGVAGCLAQQEKEALFRQAPHLDFVLGTMALQQLPRLLDEAVARHAARDLTPAGPGLPAAPPSAGRPEGRRRIIDTSEYPDNHLFPPEVTRRAVAAKALVTIMEGCNHGCTYCVVPGVRGTERYRPFADILDEVRVLVDSGYREIEFLGQNVNSYAGGCTFAALLDRTSDIQDLEWIRFTTSHPMNFTRELAHTLVANPKIAPFLHLPIQSGSDRILRRMRREYTVDQYLERLGYLGEGRARMAISTDFIVGFPGETDADFEDTLGLLDRVAFDASFSFVYSPRPGTPALRYPDDLPAAVKSRRLTLLQERQKALTTASHARFVGRVVPVRVESQGPTAQGHWLARTGEWVNVHLQGGGASLPFGRLVQARILDSGPHWIAGELAGDP